VTCNLRDAALNALAVTQCRTKQRWTGNRVSGVGSTTCCATNAVTFGTFQQWPSNHGEGGGAADTQAHGP